MSPSDFKESAAAIVSVDWLGIHSEHVLANSIAKREASIELKRRGRTFVDLRVA